MRHDNETEVQWEGRVARYVKDVVQHFGPQRIYDLARNIRLPPDLIRHLPALCKDLWVDDAMIHGGPRPMPKFEESRKFAELCDEQAPKRRPKETHLHFEQRMARKVVGFIRQQDSPQDLDDIAACLHLDMSLVARLPAVSNGYLWMFDGAMHARPKARPKW